MAFACVASAGQLLMLLLAGLGDVSEAIANRCHEQLIVKIEIPISQGLDAILYSRKFK